MKKLLFLFLTISAVGFTSCGDDDVDCNDIDAANFLSAETEALIDAAFDYGFNQTDANCEKLKSAYEDYIDAAEAYESCADQAGEGDEFREALDEARDGVADLPC